MKPVFVKLALTLALLAGISLPTFAQVSGAVKCEQPGKPALSFTIASGVGFFDTKEGAFHFRFFADKLSAQELKYYVGDQTGYADPSIEFQKDAKHDANFKKYLLRSLVVWGEIPDNSTAKLDALPAVHTKNELTGINLSSCSNLGGSSTSMRGTDELPEVIKELSFPTSIGVHSGTADVFYLQNRKPGEITSFAAKGSIPFYVFASP